MMFRFKAEPAPVIDNQPQMPPVESVKRRSYLVNTEETSIAFKDAAVMQGEQNQVIDGPILDEIARKVQQIFRQYATSYHPIPDKIDISYLPPALEATEAERFPAMLGKVMLDHVQMSDEARQTLEHALRIHREWEERLTEWGVTEVFSERRATILNFHGPPGTGKSMVAEGIATYLGRPFIRVDYAEIESKFVGDTPKNIRQLFAQAVSKDAILIFDEADSLLGKRLTHVQQSSDHGVNLTRSVLLTELEHHPGLVIFTTNLVSNYDEAFRRRILASIEMPLPDEATRVRIWNGLLSERLPLASDVTIKWLAEREGMTGADMRDALLFAAAAVLNDQQPQLTRTDFLRAMDQIEQRKSVGVDKIIRSERKERDSSC